jgi:hypothetical protein
MALLRLDAATFRLCFAREIIGKDYLAGLLYSRGTMVWRNANAMNNGTSLVTL